ncbi:Glycosyltransferase involved in cell wall bisynthesis [Franzmannia pantelleriensis]|uniref:Glycosyltransferase involved in cell wall bisynthesis n=1 Tax=Franzmannia pantelleriensis TaxID=48727 RepID=A0A1G9ESB9_9GAMM|nr:glycosyltransferase [Halomonas pantelleriensis]SDK78963.1 Glycosyltransferase involved in cell wall bisynthesis [Halomonas pantelleriensis]
MNRDEAPLVSILCATYNHVEFIKDALEGFLIQDVDFVYEIIINDDASNDGTDDVLKEYESQYPDLIRVVYQSTNLYSQGVEPYSSVLQPMAKGKYIALCDGDDFWVDRLKLRKQVEFLEKNEDYVICGHDAYSFDKSGVIKNSILPFYNKKDASSLKLKKTYMIPTLSACYRNVREPIPFEISKVVSGDTFLFSWLGNFGKYKYFTSDEIKPGAYRQHGGGVWSGIDQDQKIANTITTFYWMAQYYKRVGDLSMFSHYNSSIVSLLASRDGALRKGFLYKSIWYLAFIYAKKICNKNLLLKKAVKKLIKLA